MAIVKVNVTAGTKVLNAMVKKVEEATIQAAVDVKPVQGGATEATAVVLTVGPAGVIRKMDNVVGWFKNATGAAWEAPKFNKNTNWWDGEKWSLVASVPLKNGENGATLNQLFDPSKEGGYGIDVKVRDEEFNEYTSLVAGNTAVLSDVSKWKINTVTESKFENLTTNIWDFKDIKKANLILTSNTDLEIININNGEVAFLEFTSNNHLLTINGVAINSTATKTSVGIINIGDSLKLFVDNSNVNAPLNSDAVLSSVGYMPTVGSTGYGTIGNLELINLTASSVEVKGVAKKVRFFLKNYPSGDFLNFTFRVWRKVGSTYNLVGERIVAKADLINGLNTHDITDLNVEVGDLTGLYFTGGLASADNILATDIGGQLKYTTSGVSTPPLNWDAVGTSNPLTVAIQLIGEPVL